MLFRSVSQSRYVFIITANSGYNGYDRDIFLFNGNVVYYLWNNTANTLQTSGVNYSDGNWHHVAVSTGTGGTFLYVDGNLMQSNSALTATTFTSSTQITVGRSAAANAYTGTTFASVKRCMKSPSGSTSPTKKGFASAIWCSSPQMNGAMNKLPEESLKCFLRKLQAPPATAIA